MKVGTDEFKQEIDALLIALCRLKQDLIDSDIREFDERITEASGLIESFQREI